MSWKRKMGALSLNRVPCNLVFGWPHWGGATAYLIHSICFVCLSLQELAFVGRVCDTLSAQCPRTNASSYHLKPLVNI